MAPLLLRAAEVAKLLGLGRSKVFAMVVVGGAAAHTDWTIGPGTTRGPRTLDRQAHAAR
jgi:hypothetical protein